MVRECVEKALRNIYVYKEKGNLRTQNKDFCIEYKEGHWTRRKHHQNGIIYRKMRCDEGRDIELKTRYR